MSEKKQKRSLRIMNALSAVDGELLERCDRAGKGAERRRGQGRLFRWGFLCAACLCAVLIGGIFRIGFPPGNDDSGGWQNMAGGMPESLTVLPREQPEEENGGVREEEAAWETKEPVWIDLAALREAETVDGTDQEFWTETMTELRKETASEEKEAEERKAGALTEAGYPNETEAEREEIPQEWLENCLESGLGEYVPSKLPEGYRRREASRGRGGDGKEELLLSWSSGERILWLYLRETGLNPEAEYDWVFPVLSAGGDWQEEIPEEDGEGLRRFAVLYGDGVLAEYAGQLTEEEIRELLCLIPGPASAGP